MKLRFFLPLLLAMLACSAPGLAPRPTVAPLIFPTAILETVTPIPTQEAILPTLSLGTDQPAASTPTVNAATATLTDNPFSEIKLSENQVYYGGDCAPKQVTFKVTVSQPEKVYSVLLFVRLRNQKNGITSPWNTGLAMRPLGNGQFEYKLRAVNVQSYKDYELAWLQYQLVVTNTQGEVLGRSPVFLDQIKFQRNCPEN